MIQLWSRGWVRWLAGFAFGLALGYAFFVVGLIAYLIAGLALAFGIVGRWQLVFVSGWVSGIGAVWLWSMVGVALNCSSDPTCDISSGTVGFVGISLGILLVGAIIGIVAWWRKRPRSPGRGS